MNSIRMLTALTCVLSLGQAAPQGPTASAGQGPVVTVSSGQLRGELTADGVAVFKNIPFAQPRDLFVANYIDFDPVTVPVPESGKCLYRGMRVACGPPGLQGGKNILFHNNGDGTFADVSERSGILKTEGTYGLGVLVADFDNDGWPDIYVANDSTSSTPVQEQPRWHLYRHRRRSRRGLQSRR